MKKFVISSLIYAVSLNTYAATIVDVYGIDSNNSANLIKKYGAQVGDIETKFILEVAKISKGGKEQNLWKVIYPKKMRLITKIKQDYALAYVDFNSILYPNDKNLYTTIEVISKKDNHRLQFLSKASKFRPEIKPKDDLVDKMIEYQKIDGQLMLSGQWGSKEIPCPIYHCLPGFNHPKLKDFFALFNAKALKEKDLILKTIQTDPDPERRIAAVYLMGHFNDPHEIISFLTKHINDPSNGVRNSVMRVIGVTMQTAKIDEIEVLPFLKLLDSPYDTDRNKALLILSNAANSKKSKELIIQYGKDRLIALLHLKQPNNRDFAYTILKQISGKDLGSHNYKAWEQWFEKANNNLG